MNGLKGFTYINKNTLTPAIAPENFHAAAQIATFPIYHENQLLGALLIACPGNCKCDAKEMEVISLILNHSSGAIRRAVSHEEEMQNIGVNLLETSDIEKLLA